MSEEEQKFELKEREKTLKRAFDLMHNDAVTEMTMDEYLEKLEVSEEYYLKCLGTTKNGHLMIMKRNTDSIYINNYNEEMLRAWNANMDIQLAHDPYAVVS